MLAVALPLLTSLVGLLRDRRDSVAQQTGVKSEDVVKISDAFEAFLTKDERALKLASDELQRAWQHDIATQVQDIWLVNFARGMVRPLVTMVALLWYVYARVENIPLQQEDYAIIGGVLAFWFGFRPFEKRLK